MPGYLLIQANARQIPLLDNSVDCVVTSPPYWGLRDYGVAGQLGLEPLHDCLGWATGSSCGVCWVCQMLAVFREVRRVLKPWGTCWVNLGDSYSDGGHGTTTFRRDRAGVLPEGRWRATTLPPKNMVGIPWRFALALQADGWWLRSEIIWAKPNPMPESIKDRPTKAHEQVFLLSRAPRYFYDQEAVRTAFRPLSIARAGQDIEQQAGSSRVVGKNNGRMKAVGDPESGANLKTVWPIPPGLCKEAHFATFPESLAETCIKAGTSGMGNCPACGAPWTRIVERVGGLIGQSWHDHSGDGERGQRGPNPSTEQPSYRRITTGWQPTCDCNAGQPVAAVVLDPFVGSGTTCLVAKKLSRMAIGLDLSRVYLAEIAAPRCAQPVQPLLAAML